MPFGQHRLLPLLRRFLERYPEISVEAVLTDSVIDLMKERADVAIRAGPLREQRLVARKLGQSRMAVVAAPACLEARGTLSTPADLNRHNLRWRVEPDIAAGRLVPLLEEVDPGDEEPTLAVYVGQGKHLPARVRASSTS